MKNIEDEVFDKINEKFVENMFVHYLNVEFNKNGLKSAHDKLKNLYVDIREHDDKNVDDSISFGIQPSEDTNDFYIEHNDEICTYKLKFHYTFNVAKESFVIATISTKYEFPRVEDDGFDKKSTSIEDIQKAELIEQIKDALIVPVIADNVCGQIIPSLCFGMIDFNIFINEIWKQDYKELDVEENSDNMGKDEKLLKELSNAIKSSFATILGDISIFTLLQFETLTSQCKEKHMKKQ